MASSDLIGFDLFTLKGDPLSRAVDALRVALQQVKLAGADTESWRVEMVLADLEDDIGAYLGRIAGAVDDDAADLEASGAAAKIRQAEQPLRAG
jgi:hypothetical protein